MGFNMLDPVVGGRTEQEKQAARKLRQAISIAVDYEEYISIFANGRGLPAQSPIPPGIEGYRDGEAGINPLFMNGIMARPDAGPLKQPKDYWLKRAIRVVSITKPASHWCCISTLPHVTQMTSRYSTGCASSFVKLTSSW